MIKFNPEKFTAMVENEFSRATHVFKSPKDAEAFAREILDELANRLVTITITVCGQKVVQSGITYDKAMRLKEKFVDAVILEAWECHFRNDSLKRNYREGIQEYFCRLCPEKSCPETEMFSCECGWAGPETDLCRKYPKNWPEKQFITEEYACPKCGSFGVEEIDEYALDPEPGERVRLKGMSHAVLILGKKTSLNPMKVKYVGYYWLIGGKRSVSFGPDDIVEIV